MTDAFAIYINVHFPDMDEAKKLGKKLMEKNLCGTIKMTPKVYLMYNDGEKIEGDDTVLMTIKTTKQNQKDIEGFIYENHSWGTPCIEVLPLIMDHC